MKELAIQRDFFEEYGELENYKISLPYSNLNRWLPDGSVFTEAPRSLPVGRLNGVKQLSFISYIGINPESKYFLPYNHTRFVHSMDVGLVAGEIGRLNGFDPEEVTKLNIGGITHDMGTPAHGDATKLLDPFNLHEEDHWMEMVDTEGVAFLSRHGLSLPELDGIIKNQGTMGKILDAADRISYVMRDTYNILGPDQSKTNIDPYLLQIRYIVSHYPDIGNIYQDVGVDRKNKQIVFSDADRLRAFLFLRAHLHKAMYMYPTNMGRDVLVSSLIKPFYSQNGELNPQKLRQMSDTDLMRFVVDKYQPSGINSDVITIDLTNWYPPYKAFTSMNEANQEAERLEDEGMLVIGTRECRGFDAGLGYLVREGEQVVPFGEADPEAAYRLNTIVESTKGAFVYYTEPGRNEPVTTLITAMKRFEAESRQS